MKIKDYALEEQEKKTQEEIEYHDFLEAKGMSEQEELVSEDIFESDEDEMDDDSDDYDHSQPDNLPMGFSGRDL